MLTVQTAAQLADDAAEAIRALAHQVQHVEDFSIPDAYRVLTGTATTARRLVTAIGYLERIVAARAADPDALRADDGSDPVLALAETRRLLDDAAIRAQQLGQRLDAALNQLGRIADTHGLDE